MKMTCLFVGEAQKDWVSEACLDYKNRLSRWCRMEVKYLRSTRSLKEAGQLRQEAARLVSARLKPTDFVVLCAEHGKSYESLAFSDQLQNWIVKASGRVVFVVGGSHGLEESGLPRVDAQLSLSEMTLNHQLAWVVLLEQLYRAFSITRGVPYHKGA